MKRVRQEATEVYQVTPLEVATALGLFLVEGDEVDIRHRYGNVYEVVVKSVTHEEVEMDAPVAIDPALGEALLEAVAPYTLVPVVIPPTDLFGPGEEANDAYLPLANTA